MASRDGEKSTGTTYETYHNRRPGKARVGNEGVYGAATRATRRGPTGTREIPSGRN